jgi:hypothetical protein
MGRGVTITPRTICADFNAYVGFEESPRQQCVLLIYEALLTARQNNLHGRVAKIDDGMIILGFYRCTRGLTTQ